MRVKVNVVKWIIMDKIAKARIARCEKEGLCYACMTPLSGRVIRKCHAKCVKATQRAIDRGETTMEERIAEGKIGAAQPGGRKPSNPVTIETRQALAGS